MRDQSNTTSIDMFLTSQVKALSRITDRISGEVSRNTLGLPFPEASAIGVVGTYGPQPLMDVARRCNLDKSQASRIAESLIARQLLTREANDSDGRSVIVSLTAEGRKIFKKIGPMMTTLDANIYGRLSEPEAQALGYLLDKLLCLNPEPAEA